MRVNTSIYQHLFWSIGNVLPPQATKVAVRLCSTTFILLSATFSSLSSSLPWLLSPSLPPSAHRHHWHCCCYRCARFDYFCIGLLAHVATHFKVPNTFDMFVYLSQVLQAVSMYVSRCEMGQASQYLNNLYLEKLHVSILGD